MVDEGTQSQPGLIAGLAFTLPAVVPHRYKIAKRALRPRRTEKR